MAVTFLDGSEERARVPRGGGPDAGVEDLDGVVGPSSTTRGPSSAPPETFTSSDGSMHTGYDIRHKLQMYQEFKRQNHAVDECRARATGIVM